MTEQQFERAVTCMVQGDKSALKDIYEAYIGYIYRIIYEILQNKENAEDVTSEFFIRLWDKAHQFKSGNGHKAYLTAIARNMAIDFLRRHKKEQLTAMMQDLGWDEDEYDIHVTGHAGENPTQEAVVADMSLEQALDNLKPAERQIVSFKILGEFTFKEIADMMHIPMGTTTWKYQNAIKKLRRCGYE